MLINRQESARHNVALQETLLRSGFVKCGYCKSNLCVRMKTSENRKADKKYAYPVYMCDHTNAANKSCKASNMSANRLDSEVWAYLEELAKDTTVIIQAIDASLSQDAFSQEIEALQRSMTNWQEVRDQYVEDLKSSALRGNGRFAILEQLSDAEEKLSGIREELAIVERGQVDYVAIQQACEQMKAWCQKVEEEREELPYEQKRNFLRMLGVEVYLYREDDTEHARYDVQLKLPTIAPLVTPQGAENTTDSRAS